jgi:hypothetical protein|tara:strand:- start:89 stop:601 length:513 start_codon:yes stop_codon:yes gene_type:complete
MAYPKITVNTGVALTVIASDTIPIPNPGVQQITGTTTATTTDKLVDVGADFSGVVIGDIVYNTTDNTSATVVAIDSTTILEVSADIFTSAEVYIVFAAGPQQDSADSDGCLLYVGSSGTDTALDVKVKTIGGSIVTFTQFPVGDYLPLQILQVYATGTDANADNNCIAIW